MQLTIDKTLHSKVKQAKDMLGLPERELVERTASSFVDEAGDISDLYRELCAWDAASAKTIKKYGF